MTGEDELARRPQAVTANYPPGTPAFVGAWADLVSDEEIDQFIADIYASRERDTRRPASSEHKLDSPQYIAMFRKSQELVNRVLGHYGEPTMSLEELRALVDASLPEDFSLSDQVLKDREAGW